MERTEELVRIGMCAKVAQPIVAKLETDEKNKGLRKAAQALIDRSKEILMANENDIMRAEQKQMKRALIDRLKLTQERIEAIAEGLFQVAELPDPIGEVVSMKKRPNGLIIGQKRVPLGVVGIIYEARPNVTADAFALCFKTGNVALLKGGSDAISSNRQIVSILKDALCEANLPQDSLFLIDSTDREITLELMRMKKYVDVLIPRGSAELIRSVVENSTIPVIETGSGNCHIFVDETADFSMALSVIENAKTQRVGVCNACESLLVHRAIAQEFLPLLQKQIGKKVEIRADKEARKIVSEWKAASKEDWGMEYLDYILSVKLVSNIEEAIAHINEYSTGHSEAILTRDYANSQKFLEEIDAAAVYINASTRFTDGFEFGFGAEIGISTQKLHARGPMGLKELTCLKYIIYGNGQIRE